jgi:hypothetical protein
VSGQTFFSRNEAQTVRSRDGWGEEAPGVCLLVRSHVIDSTLRVVIIFHVIAAMQRAGEVGGCRLRNAFDSYPSVPGRLTADGIVML